MGVSGAFPFGLVFMVYVPNRPLPALRSIWSGPLSEYDYPRVLAKLEILVYTAFKFYNYQPFRNLPPLRAKYVGIFLAVVIHS